MSDIGRAGQMREIARLFSVVEGERRYFQDLAASLPQALAVFDSHSSVTWSNEAFGRMFPSETTASLADVLPTASLRLASKKILSGSREPHTEKVIVSERILRFTVAHSDTWASEPELMLQVEDLTGAVEEAQRETEARYEAVDVITWEIDTAEMEFVRVDHLVAERLGFDPVTWTRGRSFWSRLLSSNELAAVRTVYESAVQARPPVAPVKTIRCEYRITDRRGRTRWLRDRAVVHEGYIRGVSQDVTDDKDREQIASRAELIAAQRALAGSVAHDNNNLLMILRGYSEDLLSGLAEGSPLRTNVQEIVAATERLAASTKTLAAYTRKQPAPAPELIELDAFLNQHREPLLAAAPAGVDVALHAASDQAHIEIDPKRFHNCLRTLVESLAGPVRISTMRLTEAQVSILVVSASGKMPPEQAFEISANPNWPLGPELHAAYEFVRASRGELLVQETGYEILLPRAADPPPVQVPKDVILVVDDEESIRSLVRKVLERAGFRVIEAASGEAALTASLEHAGPIKLLLSDVVMPGMGGVELAENLSLRRPEMRTLLISGYTGEAALSSARLPRGFDFLQKPFSLPDLLAKVRTLLQLAN